jgi:hypothetical protein
MTLCYGERALYRVALIHEVYLHLEGSSIPTRRLLDLLHNLPTWSMILVPFSYSTSSFQSAAMLRNTLSGFAACRANCLSFSHPIVVMSMECLGYSHRGTTVLDCWHQSRLQRGDPHSDWLGIYFWNLLPLILTLVASSSQPQPPQRGVFVYCGLQRGPWRLR